MEPPSIPDNRAHKRHFTMSSTPNIVDPDDFVAQFKASAHNHSHSHSPGQTYESLAFGQPAIGRPPMRPQGRPMSRLSTNGIPNGIYDGGKFGRKPSIDQDSVTDSVATPDLGYHTIGQPLPQRRRQSSTSTGYQSFDQRSLSTISLDQQSIGTQSIGYYSTDGLPGGYLPSPTSPTRNLRWSASNRSFQRNIVTNDLPVLQQTNTDEGSEQFNPIIEEHEEESFDLVPPYDGDRISHNLEQQADLMFSSEHMLAILSNPRYFARFRRFIAQERPGSLSTLTYYLDASKSLKAIQYANALVRSYVDVPTSGIETAEDPVGPTVNVALEQRVKAALNALTAEELPAFITSTYIDVAGKLVEERVRGTLPDKFQGTAEALAEVFCLTDPSRPDNPIIFASEEFHSNTQYGMDYVLGRNCRFLQGPKTNPSSVRRIREALKAGRYHSELLLNYRRDGSPFMNLLQISPLCDNRGKLRYFIGAQIDVSRLVMEGAQMESLQYIPTQKENPETGQAIKQSKNEFQQLSELLSPHELQNVREHGGNLFEPIIDEYPNHRLFLQDSDTESEIHIPSWGPQNPTPGPVPSLSLGGVYKRYLLVRPYPSLRILFTSPSLRIPGMLQSSFLNRIGETGAKRDSIVNAMMAGRSVTARIKWMTRFNNQGRHRWIHCTPLLANNGQIGVWMVIVIDDEHEHSARWQG
ncbi:unnamed protein product [Penicillium nalgiovense]|uniref:PAC domain-containing protein n=1 Tax=Penicillium nalgiovense TaxID=60175 RepID=A0A9W4IQR0_PENNA|nr:unnamed protein product [Penicillium nalgiovense]CAG7978376.1 unnamed protein product [Penicillium nalgiovense]CAG7984748.1 unnamed protein product [Penicillium nalgiovense]CAG7992525.1 unnamed protein product [Penicillium nalgiovense]CAG7993184.1 unnamed protein product [Penicillium nalgiovense]